MEITEGRVRDAGGGEKRQTMARNSDLDVWFALRITLAGERVQLERVGGGHAGRGRGRGEGEGLRGEPG